MKTPQFIR